MKPYYYNMLKETWEINNSIHGNLQRVKNDVNKWRLSTFNLARLRKKEIMAKVEGIYKRGNHGNINKG